MDLRCVRDQVVALAGVGSTAFTETWESWEPRWDERFNRFRPGGEVFMIATGRWTVRVYRTFTRTIYWHPFDIMSYEGERSYYRTWLRVPWEITSYLQQAGFSSCVPVMWHPWLQDAQDIRFDDW